jgi:hypothetical protein
MSASGRSRRPLPRSFRPFLLALVLVGAALLAGLAGPADAKRVSGVGLLDFRKPNFKIGDWVRYRVDVSDDKGNEDQKFQEVRVVGNEEFRGEKCFWVETWFGPDSVRASYDLSLVSYQVFKDRNADVRFTMYVRLVLFGLDEEGNPEMYELRRSKPTEAMPDLASLRGQVDTLQVETLETPRGPLETLPVRLQRKLRNPKQVADSTINYISEVDRRTWLSRRIPVTSIVKEDEVETQKLQSYRLGTPSTSAPEVPVTETRRTSTAIGWGTGATSQLLELWRKNKGLMRPEGTPAGMGEGDIGVH